MTNKQALEQVKAWSNLFHEHEDGKREDDTFRRWYSFKSEMISSDNNDYRLMSDILQNTSVDENTSYEWIVGVLADLEEQLSDEQSFDEELDTDDLQDRISEYADNDIPIYNYDLTQWLAKGNNWILVDEAMEEYGSSEGIIKLIQLGYFKGVQDMYYQVVQKLEGGDSDE